MPVLKLENETKEGSFTVFLLIVNLFLICILCYVLVLLKIFAKHVIYDIFLFLIDFMFCKELIWA